MLTNYNFKTSFTVNTPVTPVLDVLMNTQEWPSWWKSVKNISLQEIEGKEFVLMTIGALTYNLSIRLHIYEITENISTLFTCDGDLLGFGKFLFTNQAENTTVNFLWDVSTTKP